MPVIAVGKRGWLINIYSIRAAVRICFEWTNAACILWMSEASSEGRRLEALRPQSSRRTGGEIFHPAHHDWCARICIAPQG